tara:strand:- start:88 stop:402 length:315 start_codon:yes stop_codon:yes gene_type:complete
MSLGIKKGDKVIVLSGRNKGKSGKVLLVSSGGKRVIIDGLNLVKKHAKRRSENEPGGLKDIPASIDASSVALFCSSCNKGIKFRVDISGDKTKTRICKKCQKPL